MESNPFIRSSDRAPPSPARSVTLANPVSFASHPLTEPFDNAMQRRPFSDSARSSVRSVAEHGLYRASEGVRQIPG
jgi:hypothetical protein